MQNNDMPDREDLGPDALELDRIAHTLSLLSPEDRKRARKAATLLSRAAENGGQLTGSGDPDEEEICRALLNQLKEL